MGGRGRLVIKMFVKTLNSASTLHTNMEPPNGASEEVGEGGGAEIAGYGAARGGEALEEWDNLQRAINEYLARNPHVPRRFIPNDRGVVPPNFELHLQDMQDDWSELTPSVVSAGRRLNDDGRPGLCPINESSSSSSISRPSLISHQISEPDIPRAAAVPAQDMGSCLNIDAPNLTEVREIVEGCNRTGNDEFAIHALKRALIDDNGTTRSEDLATFCLTKLLVLARKSDDNKRMVICGDVDGAEAISAFDAIIEAAQIYPRSAKIQQDVCAVLWSLSIKYQKHIAQNGGCNAILNAMTIHVELDALQVNALEALKVISFDGVGKSTLLSQGGMTIVSDVMRAHTYDPVMQSVGCVILGNLAVDEASQSAIPVSGNEVEVIINGMIAHEHSLNVQEAA
jgi:hypothetical protein